MAEGLARAFIDREYPEMRGRFSFSSAGIAAVDGNGATLEAVKVMMEKGIDIGGHRARSVTRGMVAASDLVLTMEEIQRLEVASLAGRGETPMYLFLKLGEAARKALAARDSWRDPADGPSELLRIAEMEERTGFTRKRRSRYEVPDPVGMPIEEYRRVVAVMEGPIEEILRVLA
jgi:protein-tyrosine-phosphatase